MCTFSTIPIVAAVDVGWKRDQRSSPKRTSTTSTTSPTPGFRSATTTGDDDYATTHTLAVHAPRISQRRRLVWLTGSTHLWLIVLQHRLTEAVVEAKTAAFVIVYTANSS